MNERMRQSEQEMRKSSRLPILHHTRYQVSQEGKRNNSTKGEAFIVNISKGGVCFFLDKKLQTKTLIKVNLPPKYAENQVWRLAKIKWIQDVPWEEGCFAGSAFVTKERIAPESHNDQEKRHHINKKNQ